LARHLCRRIAVTAANVSRQSIFSFTFQSFKRWHDDRYRVSGHPIQGSTRRPNMKHSGQSMYFAGNRLRHVRRPVRQAWLLAVGCTLSPVAFGLNTGTDLNLSLKPIAGGMAGAAYTRPQEVSSALFGNPATLTQFKGFNFGLGAAL